MKKYEAYKESGLNHIGKIPINWNVVKLKFIGDAITGITYSPNDVVDDDLSGKLVLRSSNIQNGKLALDNNVYVLKEINDKYLAKEGDILICSRNGSRNLIGKNILIKDQLVGETWGAFMTVFRTEYSEFVYYFFNSTIFKSLASLFLSSTINQLTIGVIKNFTIAIPTMEEQTQIAKYLDHKTAIIDALIEKKEQLIQKLQAQRQAIINEAVTKGLNPNVKMKDSGIEWLGEIPEHWGVVKLKYVADCNKNTLSDKYEEDFKINYIEIGNVSIYKGIKKTEVYKYSEAPSRAKRIVKTNDVIISTVRTYLKAITKISEKFNNYIASTGFAVLTSKKISHQFLSLIAQSDCFIDDIISKSVGVSYPAINASVIMNISIPFPDEAEQILIYEDVEKRIKNNYKVIDSINFSIQKLKDFRQSVISEAVTGKIDLRDWQSKTLINV